MTAEHPLRIWYGLAWAALFDIALIGLLYLTWRLL
jgi:hypothetical protein